MNSFFRILITLGLVFSFELLHAQTYEVCKKTCSEKFKEDPTKTKDCIELECGDLSSSKEIQQACTNSYNKYLDDLKNKDNACKGLSISDCDALVKQCRSSVNDIALSDGSDSNDIESVIKTALEITPQLFGKNTSNSASSAGGLSIPKQCYKLSNKDTLDYEKEQQKKIADIKEKIKEAKESKIKSQEELNSKIAENKKTQNELDKSLKDLARKVSTEKRAKLLQIQKETLQKTQNLRKLNLEIVSKQNEIEQASLSHQNDMIDFAEENLTKACSEAYYETGICLKSNRKSVKSAREQAACEKADVKSKKKYSGPGGTNKLKADLAQVYNICIQKFNAGTQQKKLSYSQNISNLKNKIKDFQSQIDDENKSFSLSTNDLTEAAKDLDQELTDETKNVQQQLATLTQELSSIQKTTQEKIKVSDDNIKELENELTNLTTAKLIDDITGKELDRDSSTKIGLLDFTFTNAEGSIETLKNSREAAIDDCKCNETSAINQRKCSILGVTIKSSVIKQEKTTDKTNPKTKN